MSKYIFTNEYYVSSKDTTIPVNTEVVSIGGFIYYQGDKLFMVYSQDAKDHIINNDDGQGLYKYKLLTKILKYYESNPYDDYNDEVFVNHKHQVLPLFTYNSDISLSDLEYIVNKLNL